MVLTFFQRFLPLANVCIMNGAVQASDTATEAPTQNENMDGNWVPVCKPEEVPKGELETMKCTLATGNI